MSPKLYSQINIAKMTRAAKMARKYGIVANRIKKKTVRLCAIFNSLSGFALLWNVTSNWKIAQRCARCSIDIKRLLERSLNIFAWLSITFEIKSDTAIITRYRFCSYKRRYAVISKYLRPLSTSSWLEIGQPQWYLHGNVTTKNFLHL